MANMKKMMPMPTVWNVLLLVLPIIFAVLVVPSVQGQQEVCMADGECSGGEKCKPLYLADPSVYPSLNMNRYKFWHDFYPLFRFIVDCYYMLVNALFALYNSFLPIQNAGQWQNASALLFMSARQAAAMIRQGNVTSTDLVTAYIARIQVVNPVVGAIVYTNFDSALRQAAEIDLQLAQMNAQERENLAQTKPLYGVPFSSKNNLENKGFVITACNQALIDANVTSTSTAPVVQSMMDAGAILTAITSMPNLGLSTYCDDTACSQVKNPHDTRRTPGGSSSGESALIASAGSLLGIGNDIGGSLRIPSLSCGVFAVKPTSYPSHTVPYQGTVPDFSTYEPDKNMLTHGPICRYADDLPLALAIMANKSLSEYDIQVNFSNSANFRLYYVEELEVMLAESVQPEQRNAVRKVKNYFEQKYNVSVQKVQFPLMNRVLELWSLTGYSDGLIPVYPNLTSTFMELYYSAPGQMDTTMAMVEMNMLRNFMYPKDDVEFAFVTSKLDKLRRQISDLLGQNGALVVPIMPAAVPFRHMEPYKIINFVYALIFNVLGLPVVAAPMGKSPETNMPLGVQIVGAPFNEALLIAVGRELEKAFGGWVAPGNVPSQLRAAYVPH